MTRDTGRRRHGALVGLACVSLAAAFLALALSAAARGDPTLDERFYFGAGASILRTGEWAGRGPLLHPPLGYYASSLPLLFLPAASSAGDPRVLTLCRAASLVAFGVPLLGAVFLWARERHGVPAGLAALALVAFSPTALAHAALVTPDLALTTTGFLAAYLHWRTRRGGSPVPWGAALGLALLAKGSAWLFVATILAQAAVEAPARRLREAAVGLAVAWLVLNAGYGFSGVFDVAGKAALIAKAPPAPLVRAVAWSAAPFFPLPYLQALATQLHVAAQGVPAFLMGEVSSRGFWSYFVVAFAIKETLPFLALLALASLLLRRTPAREQLPLLLPVVAFFLAFSAGRVQIGIRYVLPALPFLAVFASGLFAAPPGPLARRRPARAIAAVLLAGHALAALAAHPHYIAYFNELVGGSFQGHRYLVDSNLDWGQDRSRAQGYARDVGAAFEPLSLPSSGTLVVGATRLMLLDRERYRMLRDAYRPVAHVGYSYLVYDLDRPAAGRGR